MRSHELRVALTLLPPVRDNGNAPRLLELGAGTGFQAACLSSMGYRVSAVELATSAYSGSRVFEVVDYDGKRLPFDDSSFDIVFSSNVLEHVSDLVGLMSEIRRVLAPSGVAVHVLPTPAWRLWTTVAHPVWVISRILRRLRRPDVGPGMEGGGGLSRRMVDDLLPSRHGERGNVFTETIYFSRWWWRRCFEANGFEVQAERPAGILYSGCMVLGSSWGIESRVGFSRWFGSSCRIFKLAVGQQLGEKK
ncbi:class I SAM-dependent methyltransferase [Arenimonas sp. SCN 70-307]|uniref:class I SAM-dependent methyltransferase n=1 Tax=Arenimonas sp. SCN 70-307 TaxID=1660089 RepID=UPI0025B91593|nr:class I SAM-dependent methyltransferase [Arenimonas sp. SCN 70-307]